MGLNQILFQRNMIFHFFIISTSLTTSQTTVNLCHEWDFAIEGEPCTHTGPTRTLCCPTSVSNDVKLICTEMSDGNSCNENDKYNNCTCQKEDFFPDVYQSGSGSGDEP